MAVYTILFTPSRDNPYLFRDTLVRLVNSPKMKFKELIDKSA
jgi:hypothetical protein